MGIFPNYRTAEFRLLIDGVPNRLEWYNVWEVTQKSERHHDILRGQVYKSTRRSDRIRCGCLDHCFDCTVLWETVSTYAYQNYMDPYDVLRTMIANHIYSTPEPEDCEIP